MLLACEQTDAAGIGGGLCRCLSRRGLLVWRLDSSWNSGQVPAVAVGFVNGELSATIRCVRLGRSPVILWVQMLLRS